MILIDYTNINVLITAVIFFVIMNIIGYEVKKAWFSMASVIINLAMLIIHVLFRDFLNNEAFRFNVIIDFICLAVNTPSLLILDEIETRRNLIKEVFESRYNKNK